MTDSQRDVIAFLSAPESYGRGGAPVERCDTHAAIVFLAGERAFKLKRAVRYPYLDYSTVEKRRDMCVRELEVNRRIAPGLYLDVRPIVSEGGRLRFGSGSDNAVQARDWVVVMRRFAQQDLFSEMLKRGAVTRALMRELASTIADFHQQAKRTPAFGRSPKLRAVIEENTALLREAGCDAAKIGRLDALARAALAQAEPLIERRRAHGQVRRCHGDLHLGNISFIGGRPVLFDAIEFSDDFACIDTLYDLAFPLTDLLRHGAAELANALLNRYLERTDDYRGLAALPLFLACRAGITAHVAVARARETAADEAAARRESDRLVDLAIACLSPPVPRLVAIGGASGTGKSTLAYDLAPALPPAPGAIVLRSDMTRKRLLGVAETARLAAAAYSDEMHARVYAEIADRARNILAGGYSVIADAVYGDPHHRNAIAQAATASGAAFSGMWLDAPAETLEKRVAERQNDVSDATVAVLRSQLKNIRWPRDWTTVDASAAPDRTLAAAKRAVGGRQYSDHFP